MTRKINFKFDFLLWFLMLAPIFYIPGTDTRQTQLEFFKISMVALLGFFHVNKFIGLFLGYLVFQFIFFENLNQVSSVIPNIFFGAFLYHFIVSYGSIEKKYFWALYGVLLLSVFWIPIQMFQVDPVWGIIDYKIQTIMTDFPGWFALPAFLGNYAAVVLPLAFLLNPLLIPFAVIGLFFSKSSFSILAALSGALFFLWFKKRILFWIVLISCLTAGISYSFQYDNMQYQRRFNVWGIILQQAFKRPILGHGIGSYGTKYRFVEFSPSLKNAMIVNNDQLLLFLGDEAGKAGQNDISGAILTVKPELFNDKIASQIKGLLNQRGLDFHEWLPAHNEFLQVFFDTGIIGILIFGAYILDIFKRFFIFGTTELHLALMSSFVAILIVSFAHFPFQIVRLSAPFISILAFLDLSLRKHDHS